MATTETRYFRSDKATVNGLNCYKLLTTQSGVKGSEAEGKAEYYAASKVGIRVWKRDLGGSETEITSGTPVAQIECYDGDIHAVYSNTYTPTATSLNTTDSIVVRVYIQWGGTGSWVLIGVSNFQTEQLGATQLDATEWTVYYYVSYTAVISKMLAPSGMIIPDGLDAKPLLLGKSSIQFHFDNDDDSRIENFQWSITVTAKTYQGDGLTFADT